MYSDYSYYTHAYGGHLTPEQYATFAARAGAMINYITSGRAAGLATHDNIKRAECAAIDALQLVSTRPGVISESVGSESVTYAAAPTDACAAASAVIPYLAPLGLIYTGLDIT